MNKMVFPVFTGVYEYFPSENLKKELYFTKNILEICRILSYEYLYVDYQCDECLRRIPYPQLGKYCQGCSSPIDPFPYWEHHIFWLERLSKWTKDNYSPLPVKSKSNLKKFSKRFHMKCAEEYYDYSFQLQSMQRFNESLIEGAALRGRNLEL